MKNISLLMVGILAALAMLSVGVFGAPIQQASANAIIIDGDEDTTNSNNEVNIEQENECDHDSICTNDGNTVTIGEAAPLAMATWSTEE